MSHVWRIFQMLVFIGLLVVAGFSAHNNEYARATYEMMLAFLIRWDWKQSRSGAEK